MKRFQASKFKNTLPQEAKRENWYSDVKCSDLHVDNHGITASSKYIAFPLNTQGGGTVGVIPLGQDGKQLANIHQIAAHSSPISELVFAPFLEGVLATGSYDATVRVWSIEGDETSTMLSQPIATLTSDHKCIQSLAWNTCASDILAAGADHSVKVYDVNTQVATGSTTLDSPVQWVDWNYEGNMLASTWKDGRLRVIDGRTGEVVQEGKGHAGVKKSAVLWLGPKNLILTTGFSKMREREVCLHDPRNMTTPLATHTIDSSPGLLLPMYDVDTNLCFLAGKGDSTVRLFELSEATKPTLSPLAVFTSQIDQKGACMVPKAQLDVMNCEVARMLRLTPQAIIPVSFNVPRKSHREFSSELFPDTRGLVPACSAVDWLAGSDAQPILMSLDPSKVPAPVAMAPTTCLSSINKPSTIPSPSNPVPVVPQEEAVKASSIRVQTGFTEGPKERGGPAQSSLPIQSVKVVRSSKVRHIEWRVLHRNNNIDDIRDLLLAFPADSNLLAASAQFVVYPQSGAGGQLAVVKHALTSPEQEPTEPIRLSQRPHALVNHSSVLDFTMSPFHPCVVAAACEDGHVKVWEVKGRGLVEDATEPIRDLKGHTMKASLVKFHPLASDILYSAGLDYTVRGWDLSNGCEFVQIAHPDQIHSMDISFDGARVVTLCGDGCVRVWEARNGALIKMTKGNGAIRGGRVKFLESTNRIVVTGMIGGLRQVQIVDENTLEVLATHKLDSQPAPLDPVYDAGSSVLFLCGRGEGTIHMLELTDQAPYLFLLASYTSAQTQLGISFLPKPQCDVRNVEFMRALKLTKTHIEVVSFSIPRSKRKYFQDDLFPPTPITWEPTLTGLDWLKGTNQTPSKVSLCPPGMIPVSSVAVKESESSYTGTAHRQPTITETKQTLMEKMLTVAQEHTQGRLEQEDMEGVDEDEW
eukprot:Ihof_evm2s259 gene=Ihof_evmTU2s259